MNLSKSAFEAPRLSDHGSSMSGSKGLSRPASAAGSQAGGAAPRQSAPTTRMSARLATAVRKPARRAVISRWMTTPARDSNGESGWPKSVTSSGLRTMQGERISPRSSCGGNSPSAAIGSQLVSS